MSKSKSKPGVMVYLDILEDLGNYDDSELGQAFRAMMIFAATGDEPASTGNSRFLWPTLKKYAIRSDANYAKTVEDRTRSSHYNRYLCFAEKRGEEGMKYKEWAQYYDEGMLDAYGFLLEPTDTSWSQSTPNYNYSQNQSQNQSQNNNSPQTPQKGGLKGGKETSLPSRVTNRNLRSKDRRR